jgi:hypothetical protein|tara:strand:- start:721 stop:981 length:261 start_codon:yes stop_codon:yes gene_type:complete
MGSGSKAKKGKINMGEPGHNEKDWKAYRWCVRNNIAIAPHAKSTTEWYVSIKNQDKTNISPEAYEKTIIWQKIFEYCKYYYDKHRK